MDYKFGNKNQYRRDFWNFVDKNLDLVPRKERIAVYLDTSQALETSFLLEQKGYSPKRLFPVNLSPGHAAHITRKFPYVRSFGRDITEALELLRKEGIRPHVVNLDLCSPLSIEVIRLINSICSVLQSGAIIGVNVLRGREGGYFFKEALRRHSASTDLHRLAYIMGAITQEFYDKNDQPFKKCVRHIIDWQSHSYKSAAGNQTMLWSAWVIINRDEDVTLKTLCRRTDFLNRFNDVKFKPDNRGLQKIKRVIDTDKSAKDLFDRRHVNNRLMPNDIAERFIGPDECIPEIDKIPQNIFSSLLRKINEIKSLIPEDIDCDLQPRHPEVNLMLFDEEEARAAARRTIERENLDPNMEETLITAAKTIPSWADVMPSTSEFETMERKL